MRASRRRLPGRVGQPPPAVGPVWDSRSRLSGLQRPPRNDRRGRLSHILPQPAAARRFHPPQRSPESERRSPPGRAAPPAEACPAHHNPPRQCAAVRRCARSEVFPRPRWAWRHRPRPRHLLKETCAVSCHAWFCSCVLQTARVGCACFAKERPGPFMAHFSTSLLVRLNVFFCRQQTGFSAKACHCSMPSAGSHPGKTTRRPPPSRGPFGLGTGACRLTSLPLTARPHQRASTLM